MYNLNSSRIIIAALLGGAAGFLNFLLQEPRARALEAMPRGMRDSSPMVESAIMFALLGLFIGIALVVADEVRSPNAKRLAVRVPIGAATGGICGAVAGLIGQVIFISLLAAQGANIVSLIMARSIGWAAVGAGVGLAGGLPSLDTRRSVQGLLGGAIGGGIGGLLFDLVSLGNQSGAASRMIGDTAIGLFVGAAVMLVQEMSKTAWVTVALGRNEGKQYILSKAITSIGRDELSDIPLYGDVNVAKAHATIRATDGCEFALVDGGSPMGSGVNGARIASKSLVDRDVIQIGRFQLLFNHRAGQYAPSAPSPYSPQPPLQSQDQPICPFCGQLRDSATLKCACTPIGTAAPPVTSLVGVSGLYASEVFRLDRDRFEIGRDISNSIALDRDPGVSRRHATISREAGELIVSDNNSSNGTYVNGVRIQRAALTPGDLIHFGNSSFKVQ